MAKYTNSELCLIWLDSFLGLEYKHKKEIYNLINDKENIKEVLQKSKEYIVKNVGENEYLNLLNSANPTYLNYVTEGLNRRGITAVTLSSTSYPQALRETPFAPLVIYAKGNIELFKNERFAIVGSRKSLPISIKVAEDFSKSLSLAGLILVTGIAEGVDATVIKTALKENGKIISVLGGGFDNIYPASHTELVNEVAEKGLVITEYPPEIKAMAYHFPVRNRIIAGLAKGALIVSGGVKSGTQHTANYAVEYNRDLFAIPYSVGVPSGAGCNELIKKGAMLCDLPQDILSFYGLEQKEKPKRQFTPFEKQIIDALKDGEQHIQTICALLKKQIYEVTPSILNLEIAGVINKNGVNVYGLTAGVLEE